MAAATTEQRYTPFIILALVAALVLVIALWATGRAGASKSVATGPAMEAGPRLHEEHWLAESHANQKG